MLGIRTPFRVSFAGGITDLPTFYRNFGGKVISTSINKYMYHFIHKFDKELIQIKYSETEVVKDSKMIKHKIVKKIAEEYDLKGLDINSIADIQKGSGLGSSSAYTVGLLNGLNTYFGNKISKHELASISADLEIKSLGEPIGKQDQYAATFGGLNKIVFNKDESVEVQKIQLEEQVKSYLNASLLLIKVGQQRSASDILKEQKILFEQDITTQIGLDILSLVDPMIESIINCDIKSMGKILNENWELKRKLSNRVTNKTVDKLVGEVNATKGIYGTKLLGAGSGGYLLVIGEPKVLYGINNHESLSFSLEEGGSTIFYNNT